MAKRINQKTVFIIGAARSGSTLLGLILGSHQECFYAGEAILTKFMQDNQPSSIRRRSCKFCVSGCPVFGNFQLSSSLDIWEQLSIKTQKPIVIDSSKIIDWLAEQTEVIENTSSQPCLIFIQRDGRAIFNSEINSDPARPIEELVHKWLNRIKITQAFYDEFEGKKIKIRYEELANNPELIIQQLCNFLEINYQPSMLNYYQHEHHTLGGNSGTQFVVAKAQNKHQKEPYMMMHEHRLNYYQKHSLGITLDLRWKQELAPESLRLFEEMAGQENEEFQWEA